MPFRMSGLLMDGRSSIVLLPKAHQGGVLLGFREGFCGEADFEMARGARGQNFARQMFRS